MRTALNRMTSSRYRLLSTISSFAYYVFLGGTQSTLQRRTSSPAVYSSTPPKSHELRKRDTIGELPHLRPRKGGYEASAGVPPIKPSEREERSRLVRICSVQPPYGGACSWTG